MNKEVFLAKLREYLDILEDREQDDILEEYAQHIDMKMQSGLSEEEAIQDFGPMEELAAQILEAYHVKTQFPEKRKELSFAKSKSKVKDAFLWLGRKCRAFGGWLMKPFRREKTGTDESAGENQIKERGTKEMGKQVGGCFKAIGKGIVSLWRWCCAFCIWFLKLIWNLGWLMFSVMCGFLAMITLMGFAVVLIFLFQGYPFFGIFLICLGGILCFGALSCGAFSLLIREKEEKNGKNGKSEETIEKATEETEKSGGEVQYE